ncbi:MAG: hypothetical protein ABIA02_02335 [Candidatus Falkowbacteria bacterium]
MTDKYNNIFLGILIGAGIILGLMWYTKDNKSDDWWCSYLQNDDARYCRTLYDRAINKIDNMSSDEQECSPDYMGGCN